MCSLDKASHLAAPNAVRAPQSSYELRRGAVVCSREACGEIARTALVERVVVLAALIGLYQVVYAPKAVVLAGREVNPHQLAGQLQSAAGVARIHSQGGVGRL